MGMGVLQPCILVPKLKKTKTMFLLYTGYINCIKTYKVRIIANSSSSTAELYKLLSSCPKRCQDMLLSTAKRYMKALVRLYFGQLKNQVSIR